MNSSNQYEDDGCPLSALTSRIIACAVEVHKTLGPGFEEVFYQRALYRELIAAGLDASREVEIDVRVFRDFRSAELHSNPETPFDARKETRGLRRGGRDGRDQGAIGAGGR